MPAAVAGRHKRWLALALAGAVLAGGCARGGSSASEAGEEQPKVALEPAFEASATVVADGDTDATATVPPSLPTGSPEATSTTAAESPATSSRPTTSGGVAAPADPAQPTGVAPSAGAPTTATVRDREFDTTPSPLDPPPSWADLAGATLSRTPAGFELRVDLRGGAPDKAGDDAHTMNVASFFDVDGDGSLDYEIWLNVDAEGWGASYFDNTQGTAEFQERSSVAVAPEGAELVARFPLTHLAGAERFRWSIASEWGRYEVIGTAAAARDDLPDDDAAAPFPS